MRHDLRFAIRQLWRSPGFAGVVIVTLALGIGGTTAVFSVLQTVLLAPLPYEEPGQLVRFYQQEPDKPATRHYLTGAHFSSLRDDAASFNAVAALANYSETGLDLVRDGRAQRLRTLRVTSDYFHTLRAGLLHGPGFGRGDEVSTRRGSSVGSRRVVLSSGLWRSAFRADPSVVGSAIQLNGEPYEVVGVAPERFEDPIAGPVDAWLPYNLASDTDPENNSLSAIGRLRTGVSARAGSGRALESEPVDERTPAGGASERSRCRSAARRSRHSRTWSAASPVSLPSDSCSWWRASTWRISC